ncbi:MAG: hypothetical protein M3011_09950 [Actinomycetota bacterium]|nr:hypothetical protein [Actinomycetota bacterium]
MPVPAARLVEADGPTLVLGSTQATDVVDSAMAESQGVALVRRRSGGGAVFLSGDVVWVDVFVPAGDSLWDHDVGRATHWLGQAWVDALATLGIEAERHGGALVCRPWSSLVCFAGLGPGEVRVAGRKVVGISQRRTRAGALFQCAVLLAWDPAPTLALLNLDGAERARARDDLAGAAMGLGSRAGAGTRPHPVLTAAVLEDAFVRRLSSL